MDNDLSRVEAGDFVAPGLAFSSSNIPLLSPAPSTIFRQMETASAAPVPMPSKRGNRRPSRPSTASSLEGQSGMLPSVSRTPPSTDEPSVGRERKQASADSTSETRPGDELGSLVPLHEDFGAGVNLTSQASSQSDLGWLPSVFDTSNSSTPVFDEQVASSPVALPAQESDVGVEADYDWVTFIEAYASGRWDPHRTPKPPCPRIASTHFSMPSEPSSSRVGLHLDLQIPESTPNGKSGELHSRDSDLFEDSQLLNRSIAERDSFVSPDIDNYGSATTPRSGSNESLITTSSQADNSLDVGKSNRSPQKSRFSKPHSLPLPPNRLRNTYGDFRLSLAARANANNIGCSSPDITTHTAAMRLAAARVSLAPLSLPSPEYELTDPMRGINAIIPGSHSSDIPLPMLTPGESRKSRLASFWQGTQDIEYSADAFIPRSPSESPPPPPASVSPEPIEMPPFTLNTIPPATAPVKANGNDATGDYFGDVDSAKPEFQVHRAGSHHSEQLPKVHFDRRPSAPAYQSSSEVMTVPAVPRRVCLTRQNSSPFPGSYSQEGGPLHPGRGVSDGSWGRSGRAAREERMYEELGYLAPPNAPDELERRRALYKFNIWNTKPDSNFDRIVHLAKLVFSTKFVVLSLIDGNELWCKSESGIGHLDFYPRPICFGAHTILQRCDEPTVVLDTLEDWRFVQNPFVTGDPHVRFYAGAPLRTQDGFNVGCLSLVDDIPHSDFSPRQRHTLKEFAAIAMREMELWRDKIQLRVRERIQNSMEQFTRECLEVDGTGGREVSQELFGSQSMEKIYERAAKLVKRTLDVECATVMDVSHCEVLETLSEEASISVVSYNADSKIGTTYNMLSSQEYALFTEFFTKYPDGKISDGIAPHCLRPFLANRIQYALTVPIFNIDKRPFALLCAYTVSDHKKRFLEGHELSYLRAIGVIILSAVLKRRMILADKAKSLFISNISHELRTPLHGILAAAELLADSPLNHSQVSFLQTVRACGTSLVETVNHVLDFTKLSGNTKAGGVDNVIPPSKIDIMSLVEEGVEGCWIGYKARMATLDSEIGSVYSPPKQQDGSNIAVSAPASRGFVETVIDVGHRKSGWTLKCEKGGLRRVLMNIFGNSLKFTTDGFVHVVLRQIPSSSDSPEDEVKIELSVSDTGKGISQNFLKNQLFHPFSQENPLQTGTGLGLAIVNSIVRSPSFNGNIDVWSAEGVGTEIKITFNAIVVEDEDSSSSLTPAGQDFSNTEDDSARPKVSLIGFDDQHRGVRLLRSVISTYLVSWWAFELQPDDSEYGDIIIVNEDIEPVVSASERRDIKRPLIILSSSRGDPKLMAVVSRYEQLGGFCRLVYKPVGPCRLRLALKLCLHALKIGRTHYMDDTEAHLQASDLVERDALTNNQGPTYNSLPRRNSEEARRRSFPPARPPIGNRAITVHTLASMRENPFPSTPEEVETPLPGIQLLAESPVRDGVEESTSPTIPIGNSATLLKSSIGTVGDTGRLLRVLVVEDNSILRNLLAKWLKTRGYEFRDAVDGRDGVRIFESGGHFDVVLLDMSMPVLDGVGAAAEIRGIEASRRSVSSDPSAVRPTRILALTGMSSLEDKRRAFDAGVDGYLVKPVAFKTLDQIFRELGVS